jgi:predicted anti-sigma-YlaC factor YlaD
MLVVTMIVRSSPVSRRLSLALLAVMFVAASGCSLKKMAVRSMADTLSESGTTFSRDEDPELVRDAIPFALKTYESLLETLPDHEGLLLATCRGFTQYAFAFVQTEADLVADTNYDESTRLNARALKLYLRGRGYCIRALELRQRGVEGRLFTEPERALAWAKQGDVPLLYWTGASWGAAIAIGLDQPGLVADVPAVKALLGRALALQEDYERGALHAIMISIEALPETMGGSEARARRHFARAVELSEGEDPGPYVTLATSVAQPAQNRDEFLSLLDDALAIDPDAHPDGRLATLITQRRAAHLRSRVDDLFVPNLPEEESR